MNTVCVENDLRTLLKDELGKDIRDLPADAPLMTALNLDSLEALQLLVAVEDRFDIYFPDHTLSQLHTLHLLSEGIHQQLVEKES